MPTSESSKTLSGIALALMIGYYLFKVEVLLHIVFALSILIVFPNAVSRILATAWLKFSEILGSINSRIILTLIYFVVLVPVSFCYRRFNSKLVEYFAGRNLDSFFIDSNRIYSRETFEKTW
jgi:hypothetical protein